MMEYPLHERVSKRCVLKSCSVVLSLSHADVNLTQTSASRFHPVPRPLILHSCEHGPRGPSPPLSLLLRAPTFVLSVFRHRYPCSRASSAVLQRLAVLYGPEHPRWSGPARGHSFRPHPHWRVCLLATHVRMRRCFYGTSGYQALPRSVLLYLAHQWPSSSELPTSPQRRR